MMRTNIRITKLMTRLTALERERAEIIAEIETLQSAPSEHTAAIKVIPSEKAGDLVDRNSTIENKIALFRRLFRGRSDVFPIRWENRKTGRRSGRFRGDGVRLPRHLRAGMPDLDMLNI